MGRLTVETVSRGITAYYTNGPWRPVMDVEHDGRERKTEEMASMTNTVWLQNCLRANFRHQAADALSHLVTTWMVESPLEDDVSVLKITEACAKARSPKQMQTFGIVSPIMMEWTKQESALLEFYNCQADLTKKDHLQQASSWLNSRLPQLWGSFQYCSPRRISVHKR